MMSLFDFIPEKILKGQELLTKAKKSLFPAVIKDRNAGIFGRFTKVRRRTFFKFFMVKCDASATLEASLIFPIILMFFMFLFWMLELFWIHTSIETQLYSIGNEIVACSYSFSNLFSSEEVDNSILDEIGKIGFNEIFILEKIKKTKACKRVRFITALLSDVTDKGSIDIKINYLVEPIIKVPGINGVWLTNHFYSKAYVGDTYLIKRDEEDVLVYITKSGSVYHTSLGCSSIKSQINQASYSDIANLRSKDGSKYYECSKCKGKDFGELVYITPYGNRFHKDLNCSELKVDIYAIKLSEVKDRRKCKLCP